MLITDFEDSKRDQKQNCVDEASMKWRRSGQDRRSDGSKSFFEEKRALLGRRINWFDIVSSIVFPRHSKIK